MKPFSGGAIDDASLTLKYVLSHEGILPIPGVEIRALFDQNWQVFSGDHQLSAAEQQAVDDMRGRYAKGFCRRCDHCQSCSENIPIQMMMGIRYSVKRFANGLFVRFGEESRPESPGMHRMRRMHAPLPLRTADP